MIITVRHEMMIIASSKEERRKRCSWYVSPDVAISHQNIVLERVETLTHSLTERRGE